MTYHTARGPDGSWCIQDSKGYIVFGPCTKNEAAREVARMNDDRTTDDRDVVVWFVRAEGVRF